ncbi:MAG: DUF956 family protein [Catenisphaera adipataccumulans]|jgi:hypothetical protein|uniref:DUF956 family protein n=1 Tax=Catenisphaera adipataccumulans TaxID=700500 RepID=UPI003D8DDA64
MPVQSQNTKVDLTMPTSSLYGLTSVGKAMVGDKAFEYYNDRNVQDYVQIPWSEVDLIAASVLFGGRKISRFVIMTKENGNYTFSARDNKKMLRAIRNYVPADRMVRSLSFFDVLKRGTKNLFSIGKKAK